MSNRETSSLEIEYSNRIIEAETELEVLKIIAELLTFQVFNR